MPLFPRIGVLSALCVTALFSSSVTAADATAALRKALTFHAPFDQSVDARFANGDRRLYTAKTFDRKNASPGNARADVSLISGGRFGGAIRFGAKSKQVVFFPAKNNIAYRKTNWSGTVSLWLRLDPEKDLKPGYADPIQITDKRWNNASFFLDFTKDDKPRHFRLGAFSDLKFWNPKNIKWEQVPVKGRPMIVVTRPPFSRTRWTHLLWTFADFNAEGRPGKATLYVDGKSHGTLTRPQRYRWNPDKAAIMLGLSYIGDMDDLAIFNRALTPAEVKTVFELKNGVQDLAARP